MNAPGDALRRVDWRQVGVLLRAYLRLSLRRSARGFAGLAGRQRVPGMVQVLIFYAVFGLLSGVVAFEGLDVFTYALFMFSATLFAVMGATSFVAADVLLSPEESEVLGPRPISPGTLLVAKTANLALFGLAIASAVNLGPMFFGLAARGARPWFPLAHWLASALLALFCAGALVLLYGLLMRVVPRQRFERIATVAQIALTFGVIASAQLLPRLTPDGGTLSFRRALGWLAVLPITWFAALDEILAGRGGDPRLLALALAGCALTVGVFVAAVTRLAPAFGEGLSGLAETRPRERNRRPAGRRAFAALEPVLKLWMRDPVERAAFRLASAYARRDREIMMKLYPGLAPLLLVPFLMLVGGRPDALGFVLMASALLGMTPAIAVELFETSSQHAAAEVFRVAPLADTLPLLHGVRKAIFAAMVLPATIGMLGISLLVTRGDWSLLAGVLPALLLLPASSVLPGVVSQYAPLARQARRGVHETRGAVLFAPLFIGVPAIAFAGWWAQRHGWLLPFLAAELALVVALQVVLLRIARRRCRIEPAEE